MKTLRNFRIALSVLVTLAALITVFAAFAPSAHAQGPDAAESCATPVELKMRVMNYYDTYNNNYTYNVVLRNKKCSNGDALGLRTSVKVPLAAEYWGTPDWAYNCLQTDDQTHVECYVTRLAPGQKVELNFYFHKYDGYGWYYRQCTKLTGDNFESLRRCPKISPS